MKIDLIYVAIVGVSEPLAKPEDYVTIHARFVATYRKHFPTIPHRLIVVCYNGEKTRQLEEQFSGLDVTWAYYSGDGFDIGAYQAVGSTLDSDFLICCNSQVHFHRNGWMERFAEAFEKHGDGLYGAMGSFENSPHLRGPCMAMPPRLLRQYTHIIDSRVNAHRAESGDRNFTQWVRSQNKPTMMVTWNETLPQECWRLPQNIFRRGDQSNCIVFDRHTKIYSEATPAYQSELSRAADGFRTSNVGGPAHKTITVVAVTSLAPKSHAKAINLTASAIPHPCRRLLISPTKPEDFHGDWTAIPDWMPDGKWSLKRMCDFLLFGLHGHIHTDVAILVHWDGYAINPSQWTDEFLTWDYIGAPWPKSFAFQRDNQNFRVGNGGFSLRSKKWLECASQLPAPPAIWEQSEDIYACVKNQRHFVIAGCRIAPIKVAARWSMEFPIEEYPHWKLSDSFGFHGLTDNDPSRKHLRLNRNC